MREALDAARWAPSPHNAQPWRFVAVTSTGGKSRLAEAMAEKFRQDLSADGLSPTDVEVRVERARRRLLEAPTAVVACLTSEGLQRYPDARRQEAERTMGLHSLGAAIQNLLLALHSRGLGACWMCAPLFCPEAVRAALALPQHWEPQAMITVGEPAENPNPPPRLALEDIVIYR